MDRTCRLSPRPLLLVAAFTLLGLTGCAGGGTVPPTAASTTTSSTTASSSSSSDDPEPPTEDPGPTTPPTTSGNDNPAISVARLPVGGASENDADDAALQCAQVSWIVDPGGDGQIPRGTAVEITGVLFMPAVFEVVPSGCGTDQPNCVGYIFRSAAQRCDLLVRVVGAVPEGVQPSVGFKGLVYCPSNSSKACRSFVAALADQQQISVQLNVPPAPEPAPETDSSTDTSTGSPSG